MIENNWLGKIDRKIRKQKIFQNMNKVRIVNIAPMATNLQVLERHGY